MSNFNDRLKEEFNDPEYRESYADDYLNTYVATQIQVLREQRHLSQEELAELVGTKQPGISRLENVNHSSWKTETLKKIAHALGVRLKISFETYGDLLRESNSFGRTSLQRPTFDKDPIIHPVEAMDYYFIGSTPIDAQLAVTVAAGSAIAQIETKADTRIAASKAAA
jgi:transcriptional regulator with XRE-family HTH domain